MNSLSLAANLVLAHLIVDFFLQSKRMLDKKRAHQFLCKELYLHAILHGFFAWLVVFQLKFYLYALIILVSHAILDGCENYFHSKRFWPFVANQIAHVGIILYCASVYNCASDWRQFFFIPGKYELLAPAIISALVFLTRPVNIFIHELFDWNRTRPANIGAHLPDNYFCFADGAKRMPNASCWIGAFERVLAFVFVIIGNYQAIGFIMAAKSILRFKESDGPRAEYVLVGTFMSITIAVLSALLICKITALN